MNIDEFFTDKLNRSLEKYGNDFRNEGVSEEDISKRKIKMKEDADMSLSFYKTLVYNTIGESYAKGTEENFWELSLDEKCNSLKDFISDFCLLSEEMNVVFPEVLVLIALIRLEENITGNLALEF